MNAPTSITLSLVSHTNAGKTTLARTLLGRDIGEVRDAPHVTDTADVHTLLETPAGESLRLADTPGFGDTVRLLRRLRQSTTPIGWFLSAVWDRWTDRPFWSTQQALRHVRDEADVVLYLVNASEQPAAAGYVAPEMEMLAWIGKPVVVLLNQLGAPGPGDAEAQRWRQALAGHGHVVAVLPLDAFARCWVQEFELLHTVERALDGESRACMERLRAAWQAHRLATFDAALDAIAQSLGRIGAARQVVADGAPLSDGMRRLASALGFGKGGEEPASAAQQALAAAFDEEVRANTAHLIGLHGLRGDAQAQILARLAQHYEVRLRVGEGRAAMWGGVVTGALAGLKADIATGGLTLGGGLIAGGLIGALSAAGLARCYNLVRGSEHSWLAWNAQALDQAVESALLRYLAVAHFGRGRGDWVEAESPPSWGEAVSAALAPQRAALAALWRSRDPRSDESAEAERLAAGLRPIVGQAARDLLRGLYPHTPLIDNPRS